MGGGVHVVRQQRRHVRCTVYGACQDTILLVHNAQTLPPVVLSDLSVTSMVRLGWVGLAGVASA